MIKTSKKVTARKKWAPLLLSLCYAILFYLSYSLLSFYTDFTYLKQLQIADKLVGVAHTIPIVIVATLYLRSLIKQEQWVHFIAISQGYIIYHMLLMLLFPHLQSNWIKLLAYLGHHAIFLWTTYQVDRYPRLLAQGVLGQIAILPLYSWWALKSIAPTYPLSYQLLTLLMLLTMLFSKVINFTIMGIKFWKKPKVTLLELVIISPMIFMNYIWFGYLAYRSTAVFL